MAVRTQDERHREMDELFKSTKNNEGNQGGERAVSQVQKKTFSERIHAQEKEVTSKEHR